MDYPTILLALAFAFTLFRFLGTLSRKIKKLPPGPPPLPLIGNLHLLGTLPHTAIAKLSKIHGPIMYMKLGQMHTVVISSPLLAKDVLQKHDLAFSAKHIPDAIRSHNHYKYSVLWLPIESRWRSLRKIMTSNMFTNNKMDANQHLRSAKVQDLVAVCRKSSYSGEAVDIGRAAFMTTLSLTSNTVFSKDLADPYSDSAKEFKDLVRNLTSEIGKINLVDYFPVLARIDPQGIRRRMVGYAGKLLKLLGEQIDERLEKKKRGGEEIYNDVLEVLLAANEANPEEFDRNQIEHLCLDIFAAATDTTSSTVEWAMAEVMKNPDIMRKAQKELEEVIGRGKQLEEADVTRLPYLRCIVKETLRLHPTTPFLIPRVVEKDVELQGYTIPKGSQVLVNAWAIVRDSNVWDDALTFKPERFWQSTMDIYGHDFELIPFGAGRRICPGLPLAIRMVPLILGSLLNLFNWKLDGGIAPKELNMEEKFGITLHKAHPLRAIPIPL